MGQRGRIGAFRATRRTAVAAAVLSLLAAPACSGGADQATGARVPSGEEAAAAPTTSAPPTSVAAAESYDVPEVIDQAYVQRVVSAYDKVLGDAIRVLKRDGAMTEEFLSHLLAIYTQQEFEVHQRAWAEALAQGRVSKTPANPGDPMTLVHAVVEASPDCIIVRSDSDLTSTLTVAPEESPEDDYLVLVRKPPDRDPERRNATPWVMAFDGSKTDNTVPRDSCGD